MEIPQYENKMERPRRTVKIRGSTVMLVWNGYDWIFDIKTAAERKAEARDKEGELCQV